MTTLPCHMDAENWLLHLFYSQAAREGGVIRRKIWDVERIVGRDAFVSEMRRRGYRVYENSGQFVIFCNRETVRRVV